MTETVTEQMSENPSSENENKILGQMTAVSFSGNVLMATFKLVAGIIGHSTAMMSDAVHSCSHVFTTLIALIGVKLGEKPADEEHPYGHDRFESIASLVLGVILTGAAIEIAMSGMTAIFTGSYKTEETPGIIAMIAAFLSIVINEGMYLYVRHYASKIHSSAFMAAALHDRADSLSSVGALIGIIGAILGFKIMDSLASLVICIFLFQSAWEILKEAFDEMLDVSEGEDFDRKIRDCVSSQDGVIEIDFLRSRKFGTKVYVDMEIGVDGSQKLEQAHDIARQVHDDVEQRFPNVKHIMIHINPVQKNDVSECATTTKTLSM